MSTSSTSEICIEATGLARRYQRHWALAHVDLTVRAGESVALLGTNGSGKTTLVRILGTALAPSRGDLKLFGLPQPAGRTAARPRLALLSHQNYLYATFTARENLELAARFLGGDAASRIDGLLERVGLGERTDSPAMTFSAGMKKRLALARLLLQRPRLVLLDEPYAQLDPPGYRLIDEVVDELLDDGAAVVMATHQLARGLARCRQAMVLRQGQVVWRGASEGALETVQRIVEGLEAAS